MDVLSDILDVLQLRGTLYFRTAFSPPWSVAVPPSGRTARFHLMVEGRCHIRIGADRIVALGPGDLILIPNGAGHILSDTPDRPALTLDDVIQRSGYKGEGVLAFGGEPSADADTKMICGHMSFADGADHPLLRALPDFLLVTAELRTRATWLDELMRLIARQMFSGSPGANASVIRLTEAMFIEAVRVCADQDDALARVVSAMSDPGVGSALSLMHRHMDADWTLDRIAREVGMSRSRLAQRFQSYMSCAPMSYLTDLRLQKALSLLSGTNEPIQRIASRVGYRSAAAFTRAFAGRFGRSPRELRRTAS